MPERELIDVPETPRSAVRRSRSTDPADIVRGVELRQVAAPPGWITPPSTASWRSH